MSPKVNWPKKSLEERLQAFRAWLATQNLGSKYLVIEILDEVRRDSSSFHVSGFTPSHSYQPYSGDDEEEEE